MIGCGCSSVCIPWLARGQSSVIGCASPNGHSNQVFALLPFGRAITFISQHLGLPSPYGYFAVSTGYFDSANTLYAPEGGDSSQAPNAFRRSTFARGRSSQVQMTHPSGIRIYVPPALRDSGLRNSHSASAHSVSSELPKCPLFPCQLRAGWVSPAVFLDLHSLIGIRPKRC